MVKDKASYFVFANPFVAIIIIVGMTLCHFGCYNPKLVPDEKLGPLGFVYHYLAYSKPDVFKIIYFAALFVHGMEGLYAFYLTKKKGITDPLARFKWFIQTTLLGIGSLSLLLKYNPQHED